VGAVVKIRIEHVLPCVHARIAAAASPRVAPGGLAPGEIGEETSRDAELVARVLAGDAEAVRELVRRHLRAAHSVARAVLGNVADAEDACQDAFAAVFARLDQCRPASAFRPWLLRCVRNRAISIRRRQQVRRAEVLGTGAGETDAPAPAAFDPLAAAERAELRGRLAAALDTLSDVQREVLLLHDVEGWKHEEIAAHLGVRPGTSRSYLFSARRRMRAVLGLALAPGAR